MKRNFETLTLLVAILITATFGCDRTQQQMILSGSDASDGMIPPMQGSDEESAVQLALTETYDHTRNGARLIMVYDAATNTFKGTVENTTNAVLQQVRVEIHLFDSIAGVTTAELGPTTPKDLAPGEIQDIVLVAVDEPFDMWTAHPEVGPSSGGGEDGGEHAGGAEAGGDGGTAPEGTGEGAEGGGEHAGGTEGAEGGGN